MKEISRTPVPPYYAVIFTSIRNEVDYGYQEMSEKMEELVRQQPGYLGHESARQSVGITVSYWESLEAIRNWRKNSEHMIAQQRGRDTWYQSYKIRICKVERDYGSGFVL